MNCAFIYIVAQSHHEVTDVHYDCALHRRCLDPLPVAVQDLKTAGHVLPEQSEELEISVAPKSDRVVLCLFFSCGGIVVEDSVSSRVGCTTVEIVFFQIKTQGEDSHQFPGQGQARSPVVQDFFLELRQVRCLFPDKFFSPYPWFHFLWDCIHVLCVRIILRSISPAKL